MARFWTASALFHAPWWAPPLYGLAEADDGGADAAREGDARPAALAGGAAPATEGATTDPGRGARGAASGTSEAQDEPPAAREPVSAPARPVSSSDSAISAGTASSGGVHAQLLSMLRGALSGGDALWMPARRQWVTWAACEPAAVPSAAPMPAVLSDAGWPDAESLWYVDDVARGTLRCTDVVRDVAYRVTMQDACLPDELWRPFCAVREQSPGPGQTPASEVARALGVLVRCVVATYV